MNPSEDDHHGHGQAMAAKTDNGVKDPVCGMTVDPHTTPHRYSGSIEPPAKQMGLKRNGKKNSTRAGAGQAANDGQGRAGRNALS